uniref:Uncharacterized protein n=1 Tax=Conchiformibius kuhniae TaxID=211502 RepID=A0A8T9MX61_9NEIS|nr:hypothetical protein LVJ77_04685 [Conchiformibius kuhniae]
MGYVNDTYVLNPTKAQLNRSRLDLVVAGTAQAVLMVESEADILSEDIMLGAVVYGHEQMQTVINAINELADEVNPAVWDWQAPVADAELVAKVKEIAGDTVQAAFQIREKQARGAKIAEAWSAVETALITEDTDTLKANEIKGIFKQLEADVVRGQILEGKPRIDGTATPAPCARLTFKPMCCRARTAPPCSHAAKRRHLPLPRSARPATSKSSMP